MSVAIIGAGLCGLTLARTLKNKETIVLEKSRGIGGRIATRRIENLGFDHGALALDPSPELRDQLKALSVPLVEDEQGLWMKSGMNAIAKALSADLPIERDQKIQKLQFDGSWELTAESGQTWRASTVILTAPVPQALLLLEENQIPFPSSLRQIQYEKALLLLAIAESMSQHSPEHSLVSMKDRSLHPNGFVLRASPGFSELHFEESDEVLRQRLLDLVDVQGLAHAEVKKWRYSRPLNVFPLPFLSLGRGLYLAGDGFHSPGASGAFASAKALSEHLDHSL